MQGEFEISMMGEFNLFLGLQVKKLNGTFLSQSKYYKDLLKIFDMDKCKKSYHNNLNKLLHGFG